MKDDTKIVARGRDPEANFGIVNPPVYHASTIIFPDLATFERRGELRVRYGRVGTPTTFALEEAVADLEGGANAVVTSSGLAAISIALTAFLATGDHLLMVDTVYGPGRKFCDEVLSRYGIEVTYYDPLVGAGVADLIRPNTRVVYTESPGSQTFEVQDIPAIAGAAHAAGAVVVIDNTWGTPLHFKSFAHGADVSVHAATKYIAGHSDVMLGLVVGTDATYPALKQACVLWGQTAGPDDVYLSLRGLRSMSARLKQHAESGLAVARWLGERPEVARVIHPALPDDRGHALWSRDFTGACGLLGCVLAKPYKKPALAAMLDNMRLFALGFSWGGFESLIVPVDPVRTATRWQAPGPLLRLHVGLEDPEDLITDLADGLARLATG